MPRRAGTRFRISNPAQLHTYTNLQCIQWYLGSTRTNQTIIFKQILICFRVMWCHPSEVTFKPRDWDVGVPAHDCHPYHIPLANLTAGGGPTERWAHWVGKKIRSTRHLPASPNPGPGFRVGPWWRQSRWRELPCFFFWTALGLFPLPWETLEPLHHHKVAV